MKLCKDRMFFFFLNQGREGGWSYFLGAALSSLWWVLHTPLTVAVPGLGPKVFPKCFPSLCTMFWAVTAAVNSHCLLESQALRLGPECQLCSWCWNWEAQMWNIQQGKEKWYVCGGGGQWGCWREEREIKKDRSSLEILRLSYNGEIGKRGRRVVGFKERHTLTFLLSYIQISGKTG